MLPHRLQQVVSPGHIAFDEHSRARDRAVHMTFGCEVHHQIGIRRLYCVSDRIGVSKVHLLQDVPLF